MWNGKLEKIKSQKKIYGEIINFGATEKDIDKFKNKVKENLNLELPDEYLNVLRNFNGLEFNGFILYGIDEIILNNEPNENITGFIEANELLYDNIEQRQYIFLGESNISWYVYDLKNKYYAELDNPSGRVCYRFEEFSEMLDKLLSDSLL